ncbi:MAG: hypothetical protein E6J33_07175 [Chloroflexi bacterium]|nr:MAG: hypothetical protein E6J33_07175 [Chloroflexota bacterium]
MAMGVLIPIAEVNGTVLWVQPEHTVIQPGLVVVGADARQIGQGGGCRGLLTGNGVPAGVLLAHRMYHPSNLPRGKKSQ